MILFSLLFWLGCCRVWDNLVLTVKCFVISWQRQFEILNCSIWNFIQSSHFKVIPAHKHEYIFWQIKVARFFRLSTVYNINVARQLHLIMPNSCLLTIYSFNVSEKNKDIKTEKFSQLETFYKAKLFILFCLKLESSV